MDEQELKEAQEQSVQEQPVQTEQPAEKPDDPNDRDFTRQMLAKYGIQMPQGKIYFCTIPIFQQGKSMIDDIRNGLKSADSSYEEWKVKTE